MSYYGRPLYRKILVVINLLVILAYLSVCLVSIVNTAINWFIAIPGIIFPFLCVLLVLFVVLWSFLKSKLLWVSLVALLLGIQQVLAVFSFHLPSDFTLARQPNTLRILQWNVNGWDREHERENRESGGHSLRPLMMDEVKAHDADVLCFEEFYEPRKSLYSGSFIDEITKMGYPYHFFVPRKSYRNDSTSGIVIFSKFPMIRKGQFDLDRNRRGDHLVYADIIVSGVTYRVFVTHLIAINFSQWDNEEQEREASGYSGPKDYRSIFSKMVRGYMYRYEQAELVEQRLSESPFPIIICGDFNDIPNSSTYFKIRGHLQDPFLKKGTLMGRTTRRSFLLISPRIDYILVDPKFKVKQFKVIEIPYSDHFPVATDLQY